MSSSPSVQNVGQKCLLMAEPWLQMQHIWDPGQVIPTEGDANIFTA